VRKTSRILGTLLIVAGALTLTWVVLVWRWQDPFTALYTHFQQAQLSHAYDKRASVFEPRVTHGDLASMQRQIASEARAYRRTLHTGDPVGRLRIGRIGLNMVVVQGTDHETLKKGPGHYLGSGLPGEGHLIYVAGHRTTYLAPFAHIERLEPGDPVTLEVPYGTFTYRVFKHRIVTANNLSVLRSHGHEVVELQACHPRFFASHRYIAYARLVRVDPRGAPAFRPPTATLAAAPLASAQG
jgi:sortase A